MEQDPKMLSLKEQPLIYQFPLLENLPHTEPGIYSITGGRQIGKSTLLKQWMVKRLRAGIHAENIMFFTGELINDHHSLVRLLTEYLSTLDDDEVSYIVIDEITYIDHWDKGVKFLADSGLLRNTVLVISGSDSYIIREARMRFLGRRGRADVVDFHVYPLSFYEYLTLKYRSVFPNTNDLSTLGDEFSSEKMDVLYKAFDRYLEHGGYLTAINDIEKRGTISASTFATYSDWIRGDVLKCGKQEHYLKEVMVGIFKRYSSQLSWNSLAKDLSIDHPATIIDYVELLSRMDVVTVQHALREDKLSAAPKKAKKVFFNDPFIFHAVWVWLFENSSPYDDVKKVLNDAAWKSKVVEASVVTHFSRLYPTFYIKSNGEVDVAYVKDGCFWPVEVKWTNQVNIKDLKQICKYKNGQIFCKTRKTSETIQGVSALPLPLALAQLGASPHEFV